SCEKPALRCGARIEPRSSGSQTYEVDVERSDGRVIASFSTYFSRDRIRLYYDGELMFDTGCAATGTDYFGNGLFPLYDSSGQFMSYAGCYIYNGEPVCDAGFSYRGTGSRIIIAVDGNCEGGGAGLPDWYVQLKCLPPW